jgi:PAS domain S-box-containing protein
LPAKRRSFFRIRIAPLGLRASLFVLTALAVLPALLYSLWLCADARDEATKNERQRAAAVLSMLTARQANLVAQTKTLLMTLARSPVVLGPDRAACEAYLAGLLEEFPRYVTFGVMDAEGWLGCSAIKHAQPLNLADRPWFAKARADGFAVGEHQVSRLTGKVTVNFAYPAVAPDQSRHVVAAAVDLDWLAGEIQGLPLPAETTFTLFDAKGAILVHLPEAAPGYDVPVLADLARNPAGGEVELPDTANEKTFLTYAPLPGTDDGLFAAIGIEPRRALAPANDMLARHLIGVALVLLTGFVATWLGGEALVLRSARALGQATRRLAQGDLSARAGLPPGPGELRELGASFDAMAGRIESDMCLRQEAEAALRANCQMRDTLFLAFPNPVFHKDVEGRYLGVNEAFARDILGRPREAVLGRTLAELLDSIPPELAEIYQANDASLLASGGVQRYEAPVRCADGAIREFHFSKAAYRDSDDRVIGLVGVMLDITRLRDYERDLRRRLAHNAAVAELSKAVIARMNSVEVFTRLVLAKARELTESPHGFVSTLDRKTGDMVARTRTDMFPAQSGDQEEDRRVVFARSPEGRFAGLWGHALTTLCPFYSNEPASHPSTRGTPEEHIPIVRFLAAPAVFEGELMGQIALANAPRPYTDEDLEAVVELARLLAVALIRGRLEQGLRDSLREKEVMLREIHHRVKNNLHSISGLLELQAGQFSDPVLREAFEETRDRIASMAQVHAEVYASGDFSAIDLIAHARGLCLRLLSRLGRGRDIGVSVSGTDIRCSLDQAIPVSLVLSELVTNSFRHAFTGRSSGTIRVLVGTHGDMATLTVADDGVGLPDGFDLNAPAGLGLVLATGLASQLRGALSARSEGGASFVLRFPGQGSATAPTGPAVQVL